MRSGRSNARMKSWLRWWAPVAKQDLKVFTLLQGIVLGSLDVLFKRSRLRDLSSFTTKRLSQSRPCL